tara:strand:- start:226 stop:741 length:516 start_codon:yes stop_codon:yes gene_type:complete
MNIVPKFIMLSTLLIVGCEIGYRTDSNSVNWVHWNEGTGKVVQPLDVESPSAFKKLGEYYGVSGDQVFYKADLVEGADAKTFEVLSESYSKDKEFVFFQGRIVSDAQASDFRPIATNYGIDDKAVFYRSFRIVGADPLSFKIREFESSPVYSCYSVADFFGCSEEYRRENT